MSRLKAMLLILIFTLSAYVGEVQAALVNFTLVATVVSADAGNGLGLNIGDSITVTGGFDDSTLSGKRQTSW